VSTSTKPNVEDFTVPEKILLAAENLEKKGQSPFTAEVLIVASWERFPSTFGLKGFAEQYPDSNKILSSIMGEKGLARRGWLVKMGQKLYALTREGRNVIRRVMMQEEEPTPDGSVHRVSREHERFLKVLFDSTAVQKFEGNRKHELTFADACRFWSITENTKGEQLDERLEYLDKTLAELDRELADLDGETTDRRPVTAGDIRVMTNIHRYMEDRFDRHLNLLRSRAVKR
jgi:DNA-binding PadR family transcriptional regulator